MITTANIRDYVGSLEIADHHYIGKLDNKLDKSIGVYTLQSSGAPVTAIGTPSTYETIGITLLIHWTNNAADTETAARQLYEHLRTVRDLIINNHTVYMIDLLVPEPIDVGSDEKGVYERVINLKIYYERNNE